MDAPTDEQLLADYLQGSSAGFELLVRRHARELHQFVMRFTANSVAAEDVVQEAFLQVHSSAKSFDLDRRFKPWLFTIAANKARDSIRRRRRRRELPLDAQVAPQEGTEQRFVDLFAAGSETPTDNLLLEERRKLVRRAVEAMPSKLRDVLVLAYYHRFPYKEIAEIVGIPLGTVKSRLHAAVANFRDCYEAVLNERTNDERH